MIEVSPVLGRERLDGAEAYLKEAVRLAGALPDGAPDPARLARIGVLGAGTMGRGIAMAFAQNGRDVVLVDSAPEAREAARAHLEKLADRKLADGRIDAEGHAALIARITYAGAIAAFADCDMVVEAVPEILDLKQKIMAEIEAAVGPDCVIATNTSTLDVDAIAAPLADPGRFIGTHFFLPAQANPLLEVIPAGATTPATLGLVMALARDLGKRAVIAANGDGFIGNRMFDRLVHEAMNLVEEGAWPDEVDAALEGWGMAIGPFRTLDMIGNDVLWLVRKARAERPDPPPQPRIGDALCEAGFLGQKTGRGWYLYDGATPRGRPYEDVHALIQRESAALGYTRRQIKAREIIGRCITALMVEGLAMVEEGRAARASDIDMVFVTGYGFPAALGGPMRLGEEIGEAEILRLARGYGEISGRSEGAWRLPAALAGREVAQ